MISIIAPKTSDLCSTCAITAFCNLGTSCNQCPNCLKNGACYCLQLGPGDSCEHYLPITPNIMDFLAQESAKK